MYDFDLFLCVFLANTERAAPLGWGRWRVANRFVHATLDELVRIPFEYPWLVVGSLLAGSWWAWLSPDARYDIKWGGMLGFVIGLFGGRRW
jgi:hypothetical protein